VRILRLFERIAAPPRPARTMSPRRPRDSQRARLYRAERAAFMRDSACPHAPYGWLTGLAPLRAYVEMVARQPEVIHFYPAPGQPDRSLLTGLEVKDGRGRRSAAAYVGLHAISVPTALRMRWVVLHELAHVIARLAYGHEADFAPHGWRFAAVYLELVRAVFGVEGEARLRAAFVADGVRFAPTRRPASRRAA